MTGAALGLVLVAAVLHATWNFLLKRAGGGNAFVWLFAALSTLLYAPLALGTVLAKEPHLGFAAWAAMLASAAIHTAYYLLLDRGYRVGDLSLVYPLARGSGPLLTVAAAILLFGERPGPVAIGGAMLIGAGAFLLTGDPRRLRSRGAARAVGFALLTGTAIAGYTLVDKYAVGPLRVPPILQDWVAGFGRVLLLTPLALRSPGAVLRVWREQRGTVLGVAVLCPLSYILVLSAMAFTPVSFVAPAREISILVAALMGTQLLREGDAGRRLAAGGAMVLGVIALAVG